MTFDKKEHQGGNKKVLVVCCILSFLAGVVVTAMTERTPMAPPADSFSDLSDEFQVMLTINKNVEHIEPPLEVGFITCDIPLREGREESVSFSGKFLYKPTKLTKEMDKRPYPLSFGSGDDVSDVKGWEEACLFQLNDGKVPW